MNIAAIPSRRLTVPNGRVLKSDWLTQTQKPNRSREVPVVLLDHRDVYIEKRFCPLTLLFIVENTNSSEHCGTFYPFLSNLE